MSAAEDAFLQISLDNNKEPDLKKASSIPKMKKNSEYVSAASKVCGFSVVSAKGLKFHQWFVKHKADLMEKKMLKPVRIRVGLGQPPRPYYTNRVECANSLLSSKTGHKELPVNEFVGRMRALTERQARNVRWAIINKGSYQLHPDLSHLQLLEEMWLQMGEEEKESYVEMVLQSDVHLKTTQPSVKNPFQSLPLSDQPVSDVSANDGAAHGFPTPAEAAFSIIDLDEEFDESRVSLGVEQAPQFDVCDGQEECSVHSSGALEDLQSVSDCTTSKPRRTSRQQSCSTFGNNQGNIRESQSSSGQT